MTELHAAGGISASSRVSHHCGGVGGRRGLSSRSLGRRFGGRGLHALFHLTAIRDSEGQRGQPSE